MSLRLPRPTVMTTCIKWPIVAPTSRLPLRASIFSPSRRIKSYDITTGTSVAAAHVSGVAALLLELKPSLKPKEIRAIITTTAKPLGPPSQHAEFGAGLVNAYRAAMLASGKSAKADDDQMKQKQ